MFISMNTVDVLIPRFFIEWPSSRDDFGHQVTKSPSHQVTKIAPHRGVDEDLQAELAERER
jgi:hypothetical protein